MGWSVGTTGALKWAMGEVVNVIVAFAVIVFLVRWATRGGKSVRFWPELDLMGVGQVVAITKPDVLENYSASSPRM